MSARKQSELEEITFKVNAPLKQGPYCRLPLPLEARCLFFNTLYLTDSDRWPPCQLNFSLTL